MTIMGKRTNNENKELEALLRAPIDKRYKYSMNRISDESELVLFGNHNEGFNMFELENGGSLIYVWPPIVLEMDSNCEEESTEIASVTLEYFVENILPAIIEHNSQIDVFPLFENGYTHGRIVDVNTFIEDLNERLEDYGETINIDDMTLDEL